MSLITAVAELREPFMWQPIGVEGHYKIIPGIEKDETLDGMVDLLSMIHPGDACRLEEMISWMETQAEDAIADGITDGFIEEEIEVLRRYLSIAQHMEASQ